MDRNELTAPLMRSFPMDPVAGLIVPEDDLVPLVLAARSVVFCPDMFRDETGVKHLLAPALVDDLDKTSEPFADMLDLPFAEATARRKELAVSLAIVTAWLDAECITLPPVHHIRALVDALS